MRRFLWTEMSCAKSHFCFGVGKLWRGLAFQPSCMVVAQSCPALRDPIDYSLPGSSVHGIFQARVLEWVVISYSRGSSQPRDRNCISCAYCILQHCTLREVSFLIPSLIKGGFKCLKNIKHYSLFLDAGRQILGDTGFLQDGEIQQPEKG